MPATTLPLMRKIEADMAFDAEQLTHMAFRHWDELLVCDPESPMIADVELMIMRRLSRLVAQRPTLDQSYIGVQQRVRKVVYVMRVIHGQLHPLIEEAIQSLYSGRSTTAQLDAWNAGHPVILLTPAS